MKLPRRHWIFLALMVFLTGEIVHYFWARWGLITVHSKTTPLAQVIRSIEKQGHVTIKTNIDPTKPVFMNVDYVTLNEAMETLAGVMEGRWQLAYVVGPDKGTVTNALASFEAGQRDETWKRLYVPMPGLGDQAAPLADPRQDSWAVKPASEPTLQAYLDEASRNVSASFWVPETWNPAVKSPPATGTISTIFSKLASATKSKYAEVIILQGSNRPAGAGDRDRGDGEPRFGGNFGDGGGRGFNPAAMDERIQNEINKLPGPNRTAAQAEHDDWKKFFESMKDLTPQQRWQRFQDRMNNPEMQQKMDDRMAEMQNHSTPDQRVDRASGYLSRMSSANAAAGK